MDLGATICTAQTPHCNKCPAQPYCTFTELLEKATPEEKEKLLALTRIKNKQGTFKESNRYYRGKILDYLRTNGTTPLQDIRKHFKEANKLDTILLGLEKDKLVKIRDNTIALPK